MAGSSTGKSQGWELSWTAALSARTEPAASDGTTAWETHRENCFWLCKIHQVISPTEGMGLSVQAVSDSWCEEKILLLRRTVDSVSLLQKQKHQPIKKKKKSKNTLYANDQNNK